VPPSWPNAREGVAPDRLFCNWMGQSNAEKKYRNHYCFTANHRVCGGVLGVGIGNSCLVGVSALANFDIAAT
jgi:hypothetical protein